MLRMLAGFLGENTEGWGGGIVLGNNLRFKVLHLPLFGSKYGQDVLYENSLLNGYFYETFKNFKFYFKCF